MRKETRIEISADASFVVTAEQARGLAIGADDEEITDAEIASLVREATEFVEKMIGYPVRKADKREFFSGWPWQAFELSPQNGPKQNTEDSMFSSMAVNYYDSDRNRVELPQSAWHLDNTGSPPLVFFPSFARPALSTKTALPVEVSYTFDPGPAPEAIRAAVSETFRHRFESRKAGVLPDVEITSAAAKTYLVGYRTQGAAW